MPKALIVYASWTGNTKEIAEILAVFLRELKIEVTRRECQQVDAAAFVAVDIGVVATYTYGSEGDLPEEIEGFYHDLGKLDLTGKIFGALGSGEEFYGFFCKSVDDFADQFKSVGAVPGAAPLKIEGNANAGDKQRIAAFAKELVQAFRAQ